MAVFRPFKAVRPKREYAARVAALPYDVKRLNDVCDAEVDVAVRPMPSPRGGIEGHAEVEPTHAVGNLVGEGTLLTSPPRREQVP